MTLAPPDRPERRGAQAQAPDAAPSAWAVPLQRIAVVRPRAGKAGSGAAFELERECDGLQLLAWARHQRSAKVTWIDAHTELLPDSAVVERLAMARAQVVLVSDDGSAPPKLAHLLEAIHRGCPRLWIVVAREGGLQGQRPTDIGPYHFLLTGDTGPAAQRILDHLETGAGDPTQISGLTWRDERGTPRSNPAWHVDATLPAGPQPAWDLRATQDPTRLALRTSLVCLPGCPTCHGAFGRTLRRRDEAAVQREFESLVRDQHAEHITVLDEVFDFEPMRAKRLLRAWVQTLRSLDREVQLHFAHGLRADRMDLELAALLRQAGLRAVDLPIGSASPRIQQELGRNLNLNDVEAGIRLLAQQGIRLRGVFGLGYEREDPRERERSIHFAQRSALHQVRFEPVGGKRHGNRWSERLWAQVRFYATPARQRAWRDWVTDRTETTWQPGIETWLGKLGRRLERRASPADTKPS